jgi:hypothetical protein
MKRKAIVPIKVTAQKPKSKWYAPTFTIKGISRETLGLILSFAEDGVKATGNNVYADTLELVRQLHEYIDGEDWQLKTPLEIP